MNDQQPPKPRGRPRRVETTGEIDIHTRIDGALLNAVKRPNCSVSYTINRALRMCLEKDHPNDLKAIAIRLRESKKEIARLNRDVIELREKAKMLGIKNIHEFEDSLSCWE
jgi:hypothetical protein